MTSLEALEEVENVVTSYQIRQENDRNDWTEEILKDLRELLDEYYDQYKD